MLTINKQYLQLLCLDLFSLPANTGCYYFWEWCIHSNQLYFDKGVLLFLELIMLSVFTCCTMLAVFAIPRKIQYLLYLVAYSSSLWLLYGEIKQPLNLFSRGEIYHYIMYISYWEIDLWSFFSVWKCIAWK